MNKFERISTDQFTFADSKEFFLRVKMHIFHE
jgi:hypothetical protein